MCMSVCVSYLCLEAVPGVCEPLVSLKAEVGHSRLQADHVGALHRHLDTQTQFMIPRIPGRQTVALNDGFSFSVICVCIWRSYLGLFLGLNMPQLLLASCSVTGQCSSGGSRKVCVCVRVRESEKETYLLIRPHGTRQLHTEDHQQAAEILQRHTTTNTSKNNLISIQNHRLICPLRSHTGG